MINNYNVKDSAIFSKTMFSIGVLVGFYMIFFDKPSLIAVINISTWLIIWAILIEFEYWYAKDIEEMSMLVKQRQELIEKFERERVAKHNLKIRQARRIRVDLFEKDKT